MKNIISIDIGTGSGRCAIFDLDGRQLSISQKEWLPKVNPKYPGAVDFDTVEVWKLLIKAIKEAIKCADITAKDVAAITSSAMREGMVLYNKDKEVIWACTNIDSRAAKEVEEMVREGLAEPIYNESGDWLSIKSPPRFWWIRKHMSAMYNQIAHMNMLSDWVLFKLSGEIVTDPSIGSSSGMFDLRNRTWSKKVIKLANLLEGIYAPVFECGTIIGKVSEKAARETGLVKGTPVVAGGADAHLALVGAGAVKPKMFTVCGGTFWQTTVVDNQPHFFSDYRLRSTCHVVPGQWMVEGTGFYQGFVMRWFRDGFCQEEKKLAKKCKKDPYLIMEELAQMIPAGSNGVMGLFSNLENVRKWIHGPASFMGFDILAPEKTGKAACIRAIEENAAYTTRGHLEIISKEIGFTPKKIRMVGGSSKGFLWPQIVSNVLGIPLEIPVVKESTSLGAVICGLIGIGECTNWEEAVNRVVKIERFIEPNLEDKKTYDDAFFRWQQIYEKVLEIADEGLLPSMWRAPGVQTGSKAT